MGNKLLKPLAGFLSACRSMGMKIVYTEMCDLPGKGIELAEGSANVETHPEVRPGADDIVIKKRRYSGFFNTDMDVILRSLGIDTVAIVGVNTDVCCFSTARDAMFLCYRVAFLSDMTGTFAFDDMGYGPGDAQAQHDMALRNLAFTTAHVMTSEEFLALPRLVL